MEQQLTREELSAIAIAAVENAAPLALYPNEDMRIETKSNRNDLVTEVDRRIEEYITESLQRDTGYPLLGEEGHHIDDWQGRVWVLDPIDGTMNFVATHRDFAISLALCEDGVPVVAVVKDVVADKTYSAIRGQGAFCNGDSIKQVDSTSGYTDSIIIADLKEILALRNLQEALKESRGHRRYGSAALEIVEVAASRAGAFVHLWVSPWDIAAATLICEEVGGKVTRMDGTPLDVRYPGSILAAWPRAHETLHQRLFVMAN